MPSQEDYLDNLLKNLSHGGEDKTAEEDAVPKGGAEPEAAAPESEPEISVPETDTYGFETEMPGPETEAADVGADMAEGELGMPEAEVEAGMAEPELEMPEAEAAEGELEMPEAEVADVEAVMPKPDTEVAEAEAVMAEPEAEVAEGELEMPEPDTEVADVEAGMPELDTEAADVEAGMPEPDTEVAEAEAVMAEPELGMAEPEAEAAEAEADMAEPELEMPEPEADVEAGMAEPEAEEAEPELEMPEPDTEVADVELGMPEPGAEAETSVTDDELEKILAEASSFLEADLSGMEEAGTPVTGEAEASDMSAEETESLEAEGMEMPGEEAPGVQETWGEDLGIPAAEEPEIQDMKGNEILDMDENKFSGTDEGDISNIEELLANLGENISDADEQEEESLNLDQVPDLDAVMGMSEDEIAKMLSEGLPAEEPAAAELSGGQDVTEMLEGTADDDLHDIQDMLQKSDNNEAVDDEIVELLQGIPEDGEDLEQKILSEDASLGGNTSEELEALTGDTKNKKALEKKRKKEEKAAARKAAREAAKAKKESKKRAKKAKKQRKNKNVQDIPVENENGEEMLVDRDELDKLLSRAEQAGNEDSEAEAATDEAESSGEDDFGLDLDNLFAGEDDSLGALAADADEQAADEIEEKKRDKKEKKDGKEKTGFLAKILSFLMEEDDDGEDKENLRLSEENQGILNDLDKEKKAVKGGKGGTGGKKDKKKENKKEKPKKEPKPKKAPKPKEEKPPKEPEPYVPPKKRLTPKKVFPVALLGVTVAAAILVFVNVSTDYVDKNVAKTAYYNGDYVACYQNLNGKELNETESLMYGRSESILYIRLWYREYEMFVEEGSEVEALDSLIQTVNDYPMLYEYASKWNAQGDVYAVYADILNILLNKYGITELQAKEIARERDDVEYTKMVVALAQGKPYGSWNQTQAPEDESLPHELPEESDLGQGNFVDNR